MPVVPPMPVPAAVPQRTVRFGSCSPFGPGNAVRPARNIDSVAARPIGNSDREQPLAARRSLDVPAADCIILYDLPTLGVKLSPNPPEPAEARRRPKEHPRVDDRLPIQRKAGWMHWIDR